MKAYIVNFILCMLLSFIADVMFKKNKKRMGIIFIILTILVMGIIAGVRSENVGTDIHNYVTSLFEYSYQLHTGIFDIYSKFGVELGFTILVFISSRFGDLYLVLFFIQLAIVLPIAIYSYKVKEQIPISINIFIFLMKRTAVCVRAGRVLCSDSTAASAPCDKLSGAKPSQKPESPPGFA